MHGLCPERTRLGPYPRLKLVHTASQHLWGVGRTDDERILTFNMNLGPLPPSDSPLAVQVLQEQVQEQEQGG